MIPDEVNTLEVLAVVLTGKEVGVGVEASPVVIVVGAQGMFLFSCPMKTQILNHKN